MDEPVLPRLELPPGAVLLYESLVLEDPDRTGNFRFYFREDGSFFNARNERLWLSDPDQFSSDAPADHWNTAFPSEPQRCLTVTQRRELLEAIRRAGFPSLSRTYRSRRQRNPPIAERWTTVQSGRAITVVVENRASPPQLVRLRETIDRLVAEAPTSPP